MIKTVLSQYEDVGGCSTYGVVRDWETSGDSPNDKILSYWFNNLWRSLSCRRRPSNWNWSTIYSDPKIYNDPIQQKILSDYLWHHYPLALYKAAISYEKRQDFGHLLICVSLWNPDLYSKAITDGLLNDSFYYTDMEYDNNNPAMYYELKERMKINGLIPIIEREGMQGCFIDMQQVTPVFFSS